MHIKTNLFQCASGYGAGYVLDLRQYFKSSISTEGSCSWQAKRAFCLGSCFHAGLCIVLIHKDLAKEQGTQRHLGC